MNKKISFLRLFFFTLLYCSNSEDAIFIKKHYSSQCINDYSFDFIQIAIFRNITPCIEFSTFSVLGLFNKTSGEDFNSIVSEVILSELVSAKVARLKKLPSRHEDVVKTS